MSEIQKAQMEFWSRVPNLPMEIVKAWHKSGNVISPVAIVATVDVDGMPHTAPFGSLRAITPQILRFCSHHDHDTYANLCRDGQVMVSLVSPPDIAVSIRGRARVVKERMECDSNFAILEIDVEEVKNDMVRRIQIDSAITITPKEKFQPWYEAVMKELDCVES